MQSYPADIFLLQGWKITNKPPGREKAEPPYCCEKYLEGTFHSQVKSWNLMTWKYGWIV